MKPEIVTLREPSGAFLGFGLVIGGKLVAEARNMHQAQRLVETWDEGVPAPDISEV